MASNVDIRVDFGALDDMLRQPAEAVWYVRDGVEYGIYQEFGTVKMAAKPFLRPAVERAATMVADSVKRWGLGNLDAAAREIAFEVQATAANLAPFRTGALSASITAQKDRPA